MNQSFKNLRPIRSHRHSTRPRGGMFILELILLLPIILLVLVLLYQVSVMMTTYQALRLTVFNAATAFAQAPTAATAGTNVTATIKDSISGYYFGDATVTQATDSTGWTTTSGSTAIIKYRLLYSTDSGTNWKYYDSGTSLATGNWLAVELKLENAENAYKRYWLLSQFVNVTPVQSSSMVLSQITVAKITSP